MIPAIVNTAPTSVAYSLAGLDASIRILLQTSVIGPTILLRADVLIHARGPCVVLYVPSAGDARSHRRRIAGRRDGFEATRRGAGASRRRGADDARRPQGPRRVRGLLRPPRWGRVFAGAPHLWRFRAGLGT